MPSLPSATVSRAAEAQLPATGENIMCLIAPVPSNADGVPRLYSGPSGIKDRHGACKGVDVASHMTQPFIFCGVPVATPGTVGSIDTTGGSGTARLSLAVGSDGALDDYDLRVRVVSGTSYATALLEYSLDGGRVYKPFRVSATAGVFAIPDAGLTLTISTGTLTAGETILTAKAVGPKLNPADGVDLAFDKLAEVQMPFNTALVVSDVAVGSEAAAIASRVSVYETASDRYVRTRVVGGDKHSAVMSKHLIRVVAAATFAEVGATGDTITLGAGQWATTYGVDSGDMVTIAGTASNNKPAFIDPTTIATGVITLDADDLVAESAATAEFVFSGKLTLAASDDTMTRTKGSWVNDGFKVGQTFTITDSEDNDGTYTVEAVTTTILSVVESLVDEVVAMLDVTIVAAEDIADYAERHAAEFDSALANAPRVNVDGGRGAIPSPISGFSLRRSPHVAALVRQAQNDIHIPTWQKALGSLPGWTLEDTSNRLVEYDDRVHDAVFSNARITSFRSWGNGPRGVFISQDLTRAPDVDVLVYMHNANVTDLAFSVCQAATENEIGQVLQLNADGTATQDSLAVISARVNTALQRQLYKDTGQGKRCSFVKWVPNTDDVFNVPGAVMHGVLQLNLNGTIHSLVTIARVR